MRVCVCMGGLFYMIIAEDLSACLPAYKNGITFKISLSHRPVVSVCESMWKLSHLGLGIYWLYVYSEVDKM